VAKNSFMKKIGCTTSEKSIRRRPRADSSRIRIKNGKVNNNESYSSPR
jgi:hypothetical protein